MGVDVWVWTCGCTRVGVDMWVCMCGCAVWVCSVGVDVWVFSVGVDVQVCTSGCGRAGVDVLQVCTSGCGRVGVDVWDRSQPWVLLLRNIYLVCIVFSVGRDRSLADT